MEVFHDTAMEYGVSLTIWDYSVTCYLTQVNTAHLNPGLHTPS